MTRVAGILFILTAAGAALFLFHIKQEVRELEEELGIAHRNILRHQEAIQVLRAEWSYLNRPARIAELAERHLDMQPLVARQFVGFEEIPYRSAAPAQSASLPTPAQAAVTLAAPTLTATAQTARAGRAAP
ncbi:MAG: cell division protein FtsL [Alphaproteobacteria bacterium]